MHPQALNPVCQHHKFPSWRAETQQRDSVPSSHGEVCWDVALCVVWPRLWGTHPCWWILERTNVWTLPPSHPEKAAHTRAFPQTQTCLKYSIQVSRSSCSPRPVRLASTGLHRLLWSQPASLSCCPSSIKNGSLKSLEFCWVLTQLISWFA